MFKKWLIASFIAGVFGAAIAGGAIYLALAGLPHPLYYTFFGQTIRYLATPGGIIYYLLFPQGIITIILSGFLAYFTMVWLVYGLVRIFKLIKGRP